MLFALLLSLWQTINYYPGWTFYEAPAEGSDVATFTFPDGNLHEHYPAFLVTTNGLWNITGGRIVCQFTVECADGTTFRYGGEGDWNNGPRPPSARLFFSSETGYDNNTQHPTNFWFCSNGVEINTNGNTVTLVAYVQNSSVLWTDAGGYYSSPNDDI